jgi:CubicO group peptidase (beta-lactamase class C family)
MPWTRIFVLLVATPLSFASGLQQPTSRFSAIADSLQRLVQGNVVPGISVAVAGADGILWEAGFGYANIERSAVALPATAYPVASVAKSLTAVAVMRAVTKGQIDLDRPVSDYLGTGWVSVRQGDPRELTVRSLLRMTGGVPHLVHFHWQGETSPAFDKDSAARFTAFAPGSQFHYSNLSFGILADLLARVSGRSFADYMAAEIFQPLGLTSSAVYQTSLPAHIVAQTYSRPGRPLDLERLEPAGGAGMFTSAHDLVRLASILFFTPENQFLSSFAREAFTTGEGFQYYSHGWWRFADSTGSLTLVADGAAQGHAATLKIMPTERIAVAVLINGNADNGLTMGLCDLLLSAMGFPRSSRAEPDSPPPEFVGRSAAGDSGWVGSWSGLVSTPHGDVPIRLVISAEQVLGGVGTGELAPVESQSVINGILEGGLAGSLSPATFDGESHRLGLNLRRQNGNLVGYLSATVSHSGQPWLVVPFYVELKK